MKSSVVYIGLLPPFWDAENIKSIIKGTGKVVDVRIKMDPQTYKNKGFCFVEYINPDEAKRAMDLLGEVRLRGSKRRKLKVELSKEGLRHNDHKRQLLEIKDRSSLPGEVILPDSILQSDQFENQNRDQQQPLNKPMQLMPEYLTNAAGNLPALNSMCFIENENDIVSKNLAAIPPAQIIQIISTLKNFIITGDTISASSVLNYSPQLTVAVAQALLMMGLVDNEVINSAANQPPPPPPPQHQPPPPQQPLQPQAKNYQPPPQQNFQPPPPQQQFQQPFNNNIPPNWANLPQNTINKLLAMDRNQANAVAQVLQLTDSQLTALPVEQKTAIQQIRAQYL